MRHVVLLGPPGAGKGTQAVEVCSRRGLLHLSTGDVLRAAIREGTDLGREVKAIVEAGRLVPDELVTLLVGAQLDRPEAAGGVVFDGFPRTVRQAEQLSELLQTRGAGEPVVVEIDVPEEEVVRRLSSRRTCPSCGPRLGETESCGACGAALMTRPDDSEEVIRKRLAVYRQETLPLTEHYAGRGALRTVDGTGSADQVLERVLAAVDAGAVGGGGA